MMIAWMKEMKWKVGCCHNHEYLRHCLDLKTKGENPQNSYILKCQNVVIILEKVVIIFHDDSFPANHILLMRKSTYDGKDLCGLQTNVLSFANKLSFWLCCS